MANDIENLYTWWFDSASILLRYFIFAGIGYLLFYVWGSKSFFEKKIQKRQPSKYIVQKEILYSILTLILYCTTSWMVFWWQKAGVTRIYLDVHQHGYAYFIFSIIVMIIIHDAYFYWTHRLMHLPVFFKRVHSLHHRARLSAAGAGAAGAGLVGVGADFQRAGTIRAVGAFK